MTTRRPAALPELRETRARVRLLREQINEKRLTRQKQLAESQAFWAEPYVELLSRLRSREWGFRGPSTRNDRRYGRDFPLYQTEQELALLRAPGRILLGVNGYALGLGRGLAGYVFGKKSDVRFASRDEAVQAAAQKVIEGFLKRNDWHGGMQPGLERELWVQRGLPDGEWFLTLHPQPGGETDVRVQDPEQCTCPPGGDFREWSFGVWADPRDGHKPEAYYFVFSDDTGDGEEYEASEVVHCKRNVTRAMKRGVPDLAFSTYDQFTEALQITAKLGESTSLQAAVAAYRKHTGTTVDQVREFAGDQADYQRLDALTQQLDNVSSYKGGRVEDFGENTEYVAGPSAQNGQTHLAILAGTLRAAAARFNAPEWMVCGASGNNDYATALSAGSQFTRTIWWEQGTLSPLFARPAEFALEHWCRTRGLEVLTPDGRGVARRLSWDQVRRLGKVECEFPSPEFTDKLQNTQRRAIMHQAQVLSPQTWQQEEGLDPEKEDHNLDEWRERHPDAGNPLTLPGGFGDQGKPRGLGESLLECGGEGGTPGPCEKGGADDAGGGKPGVAKKVWHAVRESVVSQYHELEDFYGRPAALAIVAVSALPLPGTAAAPLAARLLAKAVQHVRARNAAASIHESEEGNGPDLDALVKAVKRVWRRACEITGETAPEFDDDKLREALAREMKGGDE